MQTIYSYSRQLFSGSAWTFLWSSRGFRMWTHIKIQVLSLLCLRAVQPFSSSVKHNTDRYIASAVKESFISLGSFCQMATLTSNHPFTSVRCYSRQKSSDRRYLKRSLHVFQMQMAWQEKSSYAASFNGNDILPCCGTSSHVASHVFRNPTDSTAVF